MTPKITTRLENFKVQAKVALAQLNIALKRELCDDQTMGAMFLARAELAEACDMLESPDYAMSAIKAVADAVAASEPLPKARAQ